MKTLKACSMIQTGVRPVLCDTGQAVGVLQHGKCHLPTGAASMTSTQFRF